MINQQSSSIVSLKVLKVVFDHHLKSHELPAFRGAIADKVGHQHSLFHNHEGDRYRYRYPLIQYKRFGSKPAIFCLGEGVDEIHKFFEQRNWSLQISGRTLSMNIDQLDLQHHQLAIRDHPASFRLSNWLALNQEAYRKYQLIDGLVDKIQFLERKLTGNILSFAKGVDWYIDQPLEVKITQLPPPRLQKLKGVKVLGFSPSFQANISLPDGIGLGKGVSLGYGMLSV
jgi:hypothetical protein